MGAGPAWSAATAGLVASGRALDESLLESVLVTEPALIDQLFVNPYISIARAAEVMEVSQPTATRTLKALEAKGWLKENTGRTWGKVYLAPKIMEILEQQKSVSAS